MGASKWHSHNNSIRHCFSNFLQGRWAVSPPGRLAAGRIKANLAAIRRLFSSGSMTCHSQTTTGSMTHKATFRTPARKNQACTAWQVLAGAAAMYGAGSLLNGGMLGFGGASSAGVPSSITGLTDTLGGIAPASSSMIPEATFNIAPGGKGAAGAVPLRLAVVLLVLAVWLRLSRLSACPRCCRRCAPPQRTRPIPRARARRPKTHTHRLNHSSIR